MKMRHRYECIDRGEICFDTLTQRKRHCNKERGEIYPWSIRYKFENALYSEAEGERQVHVAKYVRQE